MFFLTKISNDEFKKIDRSRKQPPIVLRVCKWKYNNVLKKIIQKKKKKKRKKKKKARK
jgi:hypothetical protein